jgi:hypothetical protein
VLNFKEESFKYLNQIKLSLFSNLLKIFFLVQHKIDYTEMQKYESNIKHPHLKQKKIFLYDY